MKPVSDGRKAALAIKIGMKPASGPDDDGASPDDGSSGDGGDQIDLSDVISQLHDAIGSADDEGDKSKLSQALSLILEVVQEEQSEGDGGEDQGDSQEAPPEPMSGERGATA